MGVRGRPMALKRFVDGAAGDFFFQKRAPENRPDFLRVATLSFPSGRTADEIVLDDAAGLAWVANLGCIDLNPHPVRAEDLDHPDELRIDLDPVPGRAVVADPRGGARRARGARRRRARRLAEDVGLARDPHQRPDRADAGRTRRSAGRPSRSPATSSGGRRRSRPRSGGRRSATACSSTTTRTPRTGRSPRSTRSARRRTPACRCRCAGRRSPTVEPEAFTLATVPALYAERGDPGAGIDEAVGSLEALLELSARDEAEGLGDAPWPPTYRKQPGEPPRVQPSKQRRPDADYDTPEAEAEREKSRAAMERRFARAAEDRATRSRAPDRRRPAGAGRRSR